MYWYRCLSTRWRHNPSTRLELLYQVGWNTEGTKLLRRFPRAAPALKLVNTYSSCIEQACMRMFFATCAHEGYFCIKVDATNAYANSPPPDQPTSMSTNRTLTGSSLAMVSTSSSTTCSLCNTPCRDTQNLVPYGNA